MEHAEHMRRARWSHAVAYTVLPDLAFKHPTKLLADLKNCPEPCMKKAYQAPAAHEGGAPHPEDIKQLVVKHGRFDHGVHYHIVTFPKFPAPHIDMENSTTRQIQEQLAQTVLAPYLAAVVHGGPHKVDAYYVLGQAPAGGTTFRRVTSDMHHGKYHVANLGDGPNPSLSNFLDLLDCQVDIQCIHVSAQPAAPVAAAHAPAHAHAHAHAEPEHHKKHWWQFGR